MKRICLFFWIIWAIANGVAHAYPDDKNEENFNLIIDRIVSLYSKNVTDLGANLSAEKDWYSLFKSSYAYKKDTDWRIHLSRNLYLNPNITNDGFALIVCHELGHLIGGAPFKRFKMTSVEGEADFWASAVCLKKYFKNYPTDIVVTNEDINKKCSAEYFNDNAERKICYRSMMAVLSASSLISKHEPTDAPINSSTTQTTIDSHPDALCRQETYIAGIFCHLKDESLEFEEKLVKDKLTSDLLCVNKTSGELAELRPSCWFHKFNNSIVENYDHNIRSKTIFGLNEGYITFIYRNHLPGVYHFKLIPDETTNNAEFIKIDKNEFAYKLDSASDGVAISFKYEFIKKAHQLFKFQFIIEYNGEVIYSSPVTLNAI